MAPLSVEARPWSKGPRQRVNRYSQFGSPNPSSNGQPVSFTATVVSTPSGPAIPCGLVTSEDTTVLAQIPLSGAGTASFSTSNLSAGDHHVAVLRLGYRFRSSSGATTHTLWEAQQPHQYRLQLGVGRHLALSLTADPVPGPVPNVTLTLTGSASGSTLSDGSGDYSVFISCLLAAPYTVTPSKVARVPGSAGISTVDVVAASGVSPISAPLPPGCRLTAADVDGDAAVNTVDIIAIQRFFLGLTTGPPILESTSSLLRVAPIRRLVATRPAGLRQLISATSLSPFADGLGGPSQTAAGDGTSVGEAPRPR